MAHDRVCLATHYRLLTISPDPMNAAKPLPIVAALLGLAALIGAAVTLSTSGGRLEKQADEFFAQEQGEGPAARLRQPEKRIDELTSLQEDPSFTKLSKDKQEAIQNRLRELKAFQDYQQKLNATSNPSAARNQAQVRQILWQLTSLNIPETYQAEWMQTEAARRHDDWLEDAKALDKVVAEVLDELQTLIHKGDQVLANKNAADLPGRARQVLNKAKTSKRAEFGRDGLIPGSKRLSYAVVLQIAEVEAADQQWKKIRATLESVSKPET